MAISPVQAVQPKPPSPSVPCNQFHYQTVVVWRHSCLIPCNLFAGWSFCMPFNQPARRLWLSVNLSAFKSTSLAACVSASLLLSQAAADPPASLFSLMSAPSLFQGSTCFKWRGSWFQSYSTSFLLHPSICLDRSQNRIAPAIWARH